MASDDEEGQEPVGFGLEPSFVNSFYLYVGTENIRIILGDSLAGHVEHTQALVIPASVATELAKTILELQQKHDDELDNRRRMAH
jgi:hypothetical protein